jgi:hypothetical protein
VRPDRAESHSMQAPPMAYRMLFPLAAVFALTAIPLWLLLRAGHTAATSELWHGHEMLFGFALAVIAGFLSTRPAHAATWILTGTWVTARVAAATASGPLAFIVGTAFPVTVFIVTAPPCSPAPSVGKTLSRPRHSPVWSLPMWPGGQIRYGLVRCCKLRHCWPPPI